MRKYIVILFLLYLLFEAPIVLNAEEKISAGFPPQAVWLSKENAVEGESIDVYAAVFNAGPDDLRGAVVFVVDGRNAGSQQFEIKSGKAQLVSLRWRAEAGAHAIGAQIENASGKSGAVAVANSSSGTLSVNIAKAPPPTLVKKGIETVASAVSAASSAALPAASSVAKAAIAATEEFRTNTLEEAMKNVAKESGAKEKAVARTALLPVEAQAAATAKAQQKKQDGGENIFTNLAQLAAPAIVFAFGNPVIFYVLLCLLLLVMLYALARFVRRPKYNI